ncbi:reverse transcriptase [Orientia tsutsugamushi str. Ikeda]|uniref:Reverse transcriptase n=1 Tax=Orientia tsutsugamushi (strain Ikeda) TaxID=334380 RepID=B3CQ48_ORITI|nr:hypothetical protein [Orientia tsutsugamushi]BAG39743.1 reverse transcriptase [Orientia tsutsugamushi str. Ikeda]BAG40993.1 reverse transcriptase [Orientia tsutsugamushi str. Ikeda]
MAVHSIDRNTWLTKLERIKLLSSKNQDIKFNNLGHIIDLKMLEEQYKELDSKKAIDTVIRIKKRNNNFIKKM